MIEPFKDRNNNVTTVSNVKIPETTNRIFLKNSLYQKVKGATHIFNTIKNINKRTQIRYVLNITVSVKAIMNNYY